ARVALVAVHDHGLGRALRRLDERPFAPRREAAAAAAAEARREDVLDDLVGILLGQHRLEGLEAVALLVVGDVQRMELAVVLGDDVLLPSAELAYPRIAGVERALRVRLPGLVRHQRSQDRGDPRLGPARETLRLEVAPDDPIRFVRMYLRVAG